ncbi:MMPL family transporter [Cellulomonas sp. P24]|uniref:MMPL family transporter n=1 Tax=Cellulomonas sp. P24 TaxID=2885206 RepID=UPI00216AEDEC|nr:MMPL family transporter [Cellulomonas sp. P24]MCR6492387.1 MMPL family transporter [Cellulomonas sp. P24]
MATLLYRLGRWSMRRRRFVLVGWLVVLSAVGTLAATSGAHLQESFSIPGTESARAQEVLAARFGAAFSDASAQGPLGGSDTTSTPATARIILAAPAGSTVADPATAQAAGVFLAQAAAVPGVTGVSDPFTQKTIAPNASALYADIQLAVPAADVPASTVHDLEAVVTAAQQAGWQAAISGGPFADKLEILSGAESIGVIAALVVLVITLGSLLAAGMPILTALLGVGIGAAGIFAISAWTSVSSATLALALMLGLAVGIDYALFILSRYRSLLAEGKTPLDAVGRAVGTAGSAVVFAGTTVVIASAGLAVVGIPFLGVMGVAAAVTVAVAVLIAITLLPALLGFAGSRLTPRHARAADSEDDATFVASRWGRLVTGHPVVVLLLGIAGVALVAVPTLSLRLGLPTDGQSPTTSHARQAYDLQATTFGPGFNGPLVVLVDAPSGGASAAAATIAGKLGELPDVALVAPPTPNDGDTAAIVTVIPTGGPTSVETADLVNAIRAERPGLETSTGTVIWVTGTAAANIDISAKLAAALPVFLLLVIGLALVLLLVAFRSILVPVTAAIGFLLSVGASFGATVAVYQWGWLASVFHVNATGPLLSFMPVILIGVLFGLAMDYEVFLVSRMREEHVHGAEARRAVLVGFEHGSRVVLAAAVIMVSVFVAFVFGGSTTVAPMAFALGAGILVDALVVRMVLIPAVMTLLGDSAWWLPRWLDRVLPNVDIEGAALTRRLAQESATTTL